MTRFVGTPLRGIEFSSVSDEAISARVNLDAHPRIRIDAGGRLTWASGSAAGDTNLYRISANTLYTDDVFQAALGLITLTTNGTPSSILSDGALAVDTTNNKFYFRSSSQWQEVSTGAGGLLSGDVNGGILSPEIHEAEVTNYVMVGFDGGTL
jgi:hypothetical protein